MFTLENLNTAVDHPGTPFARAADTLALVEAVDSPHLRLKLDLYHAQIGEGNLIELVRALRPGDRRDPGGRRPGRCEPGTGEINYPAVARALIEMGYAGVVGLEAFASGRQRGWRWSGSARRSRSSIGSTGERTSALLRHERYWR